MRQRLSKPADLARYGVWLGWAAALLLVATLAPLAYQHLRERPLAPSAMRFQISPTVEFAGPGNFGLSPDGGHLAFVGRGPDGAARLFIRTMNSLEVRSIPGSETGEAAPPPFWSPDGRFVAWDAGGKLKKVDISGGLPQTLCDLPRGSVAVGGSWNRDGDIIFGNFGGLLHVRETGGAVSPITTPDPSRKEEFHLLPTFLPDGRHFVYLRVTPGAPEVSGAYIGTLDSKPEAQSAQRLMPYAVGITYAAAVDSGPGRLLFLREGTLMAQPFDAKRLSFAGEPVAVAERVGAFRDGAFFRPPPPTFSSTVTLPPIHSSPGSIGKALYPEGPRSRAAFAAWRFRRTALAPWRRVRIHWTRSSPTSGCLIFREAARRPD